MNEYIPVERQLEQSKAGHRGFARMQLMRCQCGCNEEYVRVSGKKMPLLYKNVRHKSSVRLERKCLWCGNTFYLKGNYKKEQKCCCLSCGCKLNAWGTRKAFNETSEEVRECLTTLGMSHKATKRKLGIASEALKACVIYSFGDNWLDYFKKMRGGYAPSGHKGMGKKKKALICEQIKERGSDLRNELAELLRLWRSGLSIVDIGKIKNIQSGSICTKLRRSKRYMIVSKKRINENKFAKRELRLRRKSRKYKNEKDFVLHITKKLKSFGFYAKQEKYASKNGDFRRVDIYIESGLFRYAIEAKIGNRTSRVDQVLGQALVKAYWLNAVPVCLFPNDIPIDKTFKVAAESYGAIVCDEDNILQILKEHIGYSQI